MKSKKIILLCISMLALNLSAQTTSNTLETAKQYFNNSQYDEAANILSKYLAGNPKDVYGYWLYGEIAYKQKEKKISAYHFEKALRIQPDNEDIRISYARSLFYSKQMEKASEEFTQIIKKGKNENYISESHLMLSYIKFWDMELDKSRYHVDQILKINPSDKLALEQKKAIDQISAPYIKLDLKYLDDDQPLSSFSEKVEFGMTRSRALNFAFYLKNYNFDTHNQVIMANFKNTFIISDVNLYVSISAGVSRYFKDKYDWLGEIEFKHKITDNLHAGVGLNRQPYLYTKQSTYTTFSENNFYGMINYDDPKLFSASFLYQYKFFEGDNHINILGAWAMTKFFKLGFLQARAGYAVSYSDTKESTYVPNDPIESHPEGENILGHYDLYFTPDNEIAHSVLGALRFNITPKLSVDTFGSYGFYARNDSPLLFITEDLGDKYIIMRTSYKHKYHPYNLKANLNYMFSDRFNIGIYYEHLKNSFYQQDKAGMQLFYKF